MVIWTSFVLTLSFVTPNDSGNSLLKNDTHLRLNNSDFLPKIGSKKSILKNFIKLENFSEKKESNKDDDFELLMGLENMQTHETKQRLQK